MLYARCVRLAQAGSLLVAAEVASSGAFRRDGERNAADWLGNQLGVSASEAHRNLETAKKLRDRPDTEDDLRKGKLSPTQADVITKGAADDEQPLRDAAKRKEVKGLRSEAERLDAARRGEADLMERYRQVQARRHLRTWTANGEFCFSGSTTPDEGARFLSALEPERQRLFNQAHTPPRSCAAMLWPANGARSTASAPSPSPSPGADVHDVTSTKRSIPAAIRRALEARDPTCSVEGCDQTKGLQIDHIWEYGKQGPTQLDNLVRLCRTHHRLKTTCGWRITGPPGNRQWLRPGRQ